jgi:hypothetical protein
MDSERATLIAEPLAPAGRDQAAIYASGFNTFVAAGHALVDGCQSVSAEMLAFWQSRLKDGLATGQRLLECDSPDAALEIQLDYAKAALQAYLDQSAKIGSVVSRSLTLCLRPPKPRSPESPALAA